MTVYIIVYSRKNAKQTIQNTNGQHFIFEYELDSWVSQVFYSCSDIYGHIRRLIFVWKQIKHYNYKHKLILPGNMLTKWINYVGTLHTVAPDFSSLVFFTGEPTRVPLLVATILLMKLRPVRTSACEPSPLNAQTGLIDARIEWVPSTDMDLCLGLTF